MNENPQPAPFSRIWAALSYLLVGMAALWPRAADLGGFVTVDEAAYWIDRSHTFLRALQTGNFADTALSAHPGVTTMWLGAAGIMLQGWMASAGWVTSVTFTTALTFLRLPVIAVHVLCILAGFALLRRMLPQPAALLAALFWAADPFLIAYSRVLHVDGLATSFGALSLLLALESRQTSRRPMLLILSGVCGGLAILSKSPALALIPLVGLLALWYAWRPLDDRSMSLGAAFRLALGDGLIWGGVVALTIVALWPALWVAPGAVINQLRFGVEVEGGQPHMLGNFFLGRPDPAPGVLFYPVTLALRSTPLTLIGLLALPLVWRRLDERQRRMLAVLALAALVFVAAFSLFPKKFNRYLVLAFPFVDILAAMGLWRMVNWESGMKNRLSSYRARLPMLNSQFLILALGALALVNAWFWHPYPIAAYNQALGGASAGARTFLTGWGEGNEQVAAWLAARPDIRGVITVAPNPSVIQPYMPTGAQVSRPRAGELPADAGYLVVDIRQVQDGELPPPFNAYYQHAPPLFTAQIHGVEYAWIYQTPPPVEQQVGAQFGDTLMLYGFDIAAPPTRGAKLTLLLDVFVRHSPAPTTLFAHLIGPDGNRVAQADLPLPVEAWTPGSYARQELPLALPSDLPAGNYRLFVGMYDPVSGARLPVSGIAPADAALAGPEAVEVLSFEFG